MSDSAQHTAAPAKTPRPGLWLILGLAALGLAFLQGRSQPELFWQSYLYGYAFWTCLGLGSLSLFLLHCLTGGQWGFAIRRILEAGTRTLPVFALLLIPLILKGMEHVYIWMDHELVAHDHILHQKAPYLNKGFFAVRMAVYFAFWLGVAHWFYRKSGLQDTSDSEDIVKKMRAASAPAIVFYFLVTTFFSIDLLMSLEPHWFSTVYGVHTVVGSGLAALSFATIAAIRLCRRDPALNAYLTSARLHDLGNLMLALTLFWTYITFTQFLIVWMGNLAEETPWFLNRARGGWQVFIILLAVFAFVLPFIILLMRPIKKKRQTLIKVAVLIFVMRIVDSTWLVLPAFSPAALKISMTHILAFAGFTGIYLAVFTRSLQARPLLPSQDPRLKYILATEDDHHE